MQRGIRGAITVDNNSIEAVKEATIELISEMQDILDEYSLLLGKERLEREEPENLVEELDNLLS